ncbi:MAG: signal recognition particle-docking protein FtsY [Candidatus Nanopelagicales bacterium]
MEILIIAILVVIVFGGGGLFYVASNRRKSKELQPSPKKPELDAGVGAGAGDEDSDGGDVEAPAGSVDVGDRPVDQATPASTEELEKPEAPAGRLQRLRSRLARSNSALGKGLLSLLSGSSITDETWEEVEETLLMSDIGLEPTNELVERLRTQVKVDGTSDPAEVKRILRDDLIEMVDGGFDRSLNDSRNEVLEVPAVTMMVGVNGTGKTTTTGKLARLLVASDKDVLLGAADTFRAAATEQLQTWGARIGVPVVASEEGADPASVAFDAVSAGIDMDVDVVLIDTAGRLHTKIGLMDELGKVKRVIEKKAPVSEVLLVIDATTGQNGLAQAKVFSEVVDVTGVVLTKLDGTAKGGIVIAIQRALEVPVKLVGLGEGPDDLAPFDPAGFVDALLD